MINRYIFLFGFIFSVSCNPENERQEIANAKWFYYSYAMEQNGYNSNGDKIDPLTCDIKINAIERLKKDTARFYFSLYQKDTLNICYLKPLGLVGVLSVGKRLYTPIYHSVLFDRESERVILERMNKLNSQLLQKSLQNNQEVTPWLRTEAKLRESKP